MHALLIILAALGAAAGKPSCPSPPGSVPLLNSTESGFLEIDSKGSKLFYLFYESPALKEQGGREWDVPVTLWLQARTPLSCGCAMHPAPGLATRARALPPAALRPPPPPAEVNCHCNCLALPACRAAPAARHCLERCTSWDQRWWMSGWACNSTQVWCVCPFNCGAHTSAEGAFQLAGTLIAAP